MLLNNGAEGVNTADMAQVAHNQILSNTNDIENNVAPIPIQPNNDVTLIQFAAHGDIRGMIEHD